MASTSWPGALFDLSGAGRGVRHLDGRLVLRDLSSGRWQVGAAGGLEPENIVQKLFPLLAVRPFLCFDAEGRLYNPDDTVSVDIVRDQIERALALCQGKGDEE